jgi:hypothetical protein
MPALLRQGSKQRSTSPLVPLGGNSSSFGDTSDADDWATRPQSGRPAVPGLQLGSKPPLQHLDLAQSRPSHRTDSSSPDFDSPTLSYLDLALPAGGSDAMPEWLGDMYFSDPVSSIDMQVSATLTPTLTPTQRDSTPLPSAFTLGSPARRRTRSALRVLSVGIPLATAGLPMNPVLPSGRSSRSSLRWWAAT